MTHLLSARLLNGAAAMKLASLTLAPLTLASMTAASIALPAATARAEEPALRDVIIITSARLGGPLEQYIDPDQGRIEPGDITHLAARIPGGARIANGELSGQLQYRGLFGERLNLRVDGQRFASGGPNLMDPAFHYAPAPLVAALVIDRGVSPVSEGPGLAGGADAVFKRVDYAPGDETVLGYDLSLAGRTVNDSLAAGGVIGAASEDWRVHALGSYEEAGDAEFAGGVIGGTAFERGVFGLGAGLKTGAGAVSLDLRRQNTGPSGNPPFPMDIQYFDTDFARLGYESAWGEAEFRAHVHYTDVAHLMDNFSLRPAPAPMAQRATFAYAATKGGEAALSWPFGGGVIEIGGGGERIERHVTITNPNNALFSVTAFPDIEEDRLGAFAQWTGPAGPFEAELGLRADRYAHEAGAARLGPALPMGPQMLAAAFNSADRAIEDTGLDAVLRLWTPAENGLSWRITLARKQAQPGYIQRFGWLPINASGGLADGNIYVGDLGLDAETAWIAEAGFDHAGPRAYARPTVFVRQIDDYIQGVPFDATPGVLDSPVEMIAAMNGDPTPLRWANVDARLWGFDLDAGYDFDGPLRLDMTASFVRGERRDVDDNLYRVAPPSLTVALGWEQDAWSAALQARAVAEQDEVSVTNSEAPSGGYGVLGFYADWRVRDGVSLSLAADNLLDETYRDHLSGYNRNGFGDAGLGERLPGHGRNLAARLSLTR